MTEPYYTDASLEPGNSVGYLVKRCGMLMMQMAERRFETEPITFTQWVVLIHLTQREYQSPTELSAHLGHDMGALTRIVDELHRKKLVLRERAEHDRRGVRIEATAKGRRLAHATRAVVIELLNEVLAPYTREEADMLVSMLQRLVGHMQEVAERGVSAAPSKPTSSVESQRKDARQPSTSARRGGKLRP